jgi:hypothetical protein
VLSRLLPASTVTISTWPRFIDGDGSITQCGAIQAGDGVACAFFARHLDKAKAFALAAVTIYDDMHVNHFPISAEQLRQLGVVSRIGEVSNINACSHFGLAFTVVFLRNRENGSSYEEERLAPARFALPRLSFPLPLEAGRFVVSATARLSQNAILLNFAVEPLQGSLERLVFANLDF